MTGAAALAASMMLCASAQDPKESTPGPACNDFGDFQQWSDYMNAACCGRAGDDCSSGLPSRCSEACAERLLPTQAAVSSRAVRVHLILLQIDHNAVATHV